MSFVGPRPEVPKFIQFYTEEQRKILSVRPGIVGPNQILHRNEGEQFPLGVDPEQFYITHILPKKLKIDLEYIENASFLTDIKYLLIGLKATILGWLSRQLIFQNWSQIAFFLTDIVLCIVSYLMAYFLRFEDFISGNELSVFFQTLPILLILRMTSFVYFGLYQSLIRHVSTETIVDVIKAVSISSLPLWSYIFLFGSRGHSRAILLIDWVLLVGFIGGSRLVARMLREQFTSVETHKERKVLIFGAGTVGELALRTLKAEKNVHFNVMGFVDDDPRKRYKKIKGIKVLGDRYSLDYLVKLYQIDEVIVAVSSITSEDLRHILSLCQKAHIPYRIFPTVKDLFSKTRYGYGLKHIGISNSNF